MTARTEEEDEGDHESNNVAQDDPALNSNGFSMGGDPQPGVIAKYKIVKDIFTVGDQKLIEQENRAIRNVYNMVFFFVIVATICI